MNNPFDRTVINPQERPVSSDINRAESTLDRSLREFIDRLYLGRASLASDAAAAPVSGFIGESLKVRPVNPVALQVRLPAGLGFQFDATTAADIGAVAGVDDRSRYKPLVLVSDALFNVPAAPGAPNNRVDIVEVAYNRHLADSSSRDVLNTGTGIFQPQVVQKTLAWDLDSSVGSVNAPANSTAALSYKVGVAGNPGGVPATSPGYIKLAEIFVGTSVTTIDTDVIKDLRRILMGAGMGHVAFRVTMPSSGAPIPVLDKIQAPPGVVIAAVGSNITNSVVNVYIFAGDTSLLTSPLIALGSGKSAGAGNPGIIVAPDAVPFTIDAPTQAALVGANASPATKVAVGQPCVKVTLTTPTAISPASAQYYCMVPLSGV